jgi:hypothetical protein
MAKCVESDRYRIDSALPEEVGWIAQIERDSYSTEDAIPESKLREWYNRNPNGFFILKTANEEKIGHVDVLPLRAPALQSFINGDLVERDLCGDDLYSPSEKQRVRDLYVESVAIVLPPNHSEAFAALFLICNFSRIADRVCNPAMVQNVYAIAATAEGNNFLKTLGFRILREAESRIDRHNLFSVSFSQLAMHVSRICKRRYGKTI